MIITDLTRDGFGRVQWPTSYLGLEYALVHADGGFSHSWRAGGLGIVFYSGSGAEVHLASRAVRVGSNNEAEYAAALTAVMLALRMGVQWLDLRLDAQLVVRQINDDYACNKSNLRAYLDAVKDGLKRLPGYRVEFLPRDMNQRADELATQGVELSKQLILQKEAFSWRDATHLTHGPMI